MKAEENGQLLVYSKTHGDFYQGLFFFKGLLNFLTKEETLTQVPLALNVRSEQLFIHYRLFLV